jgi:hypothetical protein
LMNLIHHVIMRNKASHFSLIHIHLISPYTTFTHKSKCFSSNLIKFLS